MDTPALRRIAAEHRNSARMIGDGERALARFVEQYLEHVGHERTLVRHVVYFLSHCGAELTAPAIACIAGRSERNVQQLARLDTERFRKSVTFSPKENAGRPPKIKRELIPIITEYLLTERVTSKAQIIRFLQERHGLSVSFEALDPVLKEYDLERLIHRAQYRKDVVEDTDEKDAAPLFSGRRASPAPGF
jgi:hypothetical protein